MSYATSEDLTHRFDERTIGQLLSDSGQEVGDVHGSTTLSILLAEASGTVDAAAQVGKRYSQTDLAALAARTVGDPGREFLAGIVCRIVMLRLVQRRPERYASIGKQVTTELEPLLEQLRSGEVLFDIESNVAAGDLAVSSIDGVKLRRNNVLPHRTKRFFPDRSTSLPTEYQN